MMIIQCTSQDIQTLAVLNKRLIEDEKSDNPMSPDELEKRMTDFLSSEYNAYFFKEAEEIVGYALIRHTCTPLYLRQFYIDRTYRRKHYGEKAFHELLKLLQVDTINIDVLPWNEGGLRFWGKMGFTPTCISMNYKSPLETYDRENDSDRPRSGRELQKEITMVMDKEFRGNAYIIKYKEVLLNYSGGFADLANEIPNTIETRFATASMSKTFVAVGILQLIEEEKLKFEDTIGSILDFDLKNIDPCVTVRQLLNHTSGVPDYFDESVMDEYEALWINYPNYRIRHNRDMLPLFVDKPMMYKRGEKFQYNNSGYVLLAMIIEKISGVDFDVYLKQNVFDRCGMSSTGYYSFDKLPAKCTNSYIYCPDTDDYRTNIYSVGAKGTGDGGAFVTVEDIVKFWDGLLEHKLLSEKTVNQMFSKQSGDGKDPEEGYYGFGVWIIDNPKGQDYVYMQGIDDGVSAISEYNPNNGMITVMLSNYGDNVWARMRKIRKEMY